jgi:DNA-binding NarL/FixJ family response regulator
VDTIRVLVADKNSIINDGICAILKTYESIDVIGAVTRSEDIIKTVRGQAPDVIVMDIAMSLIDGTEVIRWIRNENSDIKILLISEREDRDSIMRGLKAGSNGYIPKRATSSDLVSAILAVYRGGYFLYPSIAKTMVGEYLRIRQGLSPDPYDQLTDSEKKVLKLLAEGYKSQQIAEALNTMLNTVIRRKASVMAKLGIHNQTELIKYALRKHLIEL